MYNLQLLVFTAVISLLLLAGSITCLPVVTSENNVQVLHRKLEEALSKNSTLLFQLQKLFLFNPTPKTCYDAEVIIEVGTLNGAAQFVFHKCTYGDYECEYGNWTSGSEYYAICPGGLGEFQTARLLLSYSMTSLLQMFDPLFYYMITTFSKINRNISKEGDFSTFQYMAVPDITLRLFIDTIDVSVSCNDFMEARTTFLSLAKGYARTNGHLSEIQYGDISTVEQTSYMYCPYFDNDININLKVMLLVFAIFYSGNMVVLGLVMKYLHQLLHWLYTQDKKITDLYAITAAVLVLINCSSFIVRVVSFTLESLLNIVFLVYVVLIVVIETPFVMYSTCKRIETHKKKLFYRSLHFFACSHIIWFIHRLVTDAIIATLNFITSPAQTIGVVSIYLSMIAGTIITLKIMISRCGHGISRCSKDCCKQCLSLSCVLFMGISVVVLMVSVSVLYIVLVSYGLNTTGAGGFLLSFVPPVAALILGVYIKKEGFRKFFAVQESPIGDEQDTSAVAIDVEDKEIEIFPIDWDSIQQSNSNEILAPTQQQAGFLARTLVEPLLNESS